MNYITPIGTPLVSVVIPLYNAVSTFTDTITSVLNQTYPNLEIIIVDDRSTDNSGLIADDFATTDHRISVIHKEINQGLNMARATGVVQSTGDFITFIDSDDTFTPDAVETLVRLQQNTGADICMGGNLYCDKEMTPLDGWITVYPETEQAVYSHDDILRAFLIGWGAWAHNNNPTSACSKLFRRELLEQVNWDTCNYRLGEDDFFSLITFNLAQTTAVTNKFIYQVRVTPGSSLSLNPDRKFYYQDNPISALELCQNFATLAHEILPISFSSAIAARLNALLKFWTSSNQLAPGESLSIYNNSGQPLVSIIVPVFNGAKHITETVNSILAQTYTNLEIIIVDDLSTDGTAEHIADYAVQDARVVAIHKPINEGAALARETGFTASKGDFITFLDGDDVFTPDAIATLVRVQQSSQADISMAGYLTVDENLSPGPALPYVPHNETGIFLYSHDEMLEYLLLGFPDWPHNNNPTTAYCKLYRRCVLESFNWNSSNYRLAEDLFFSLLSFNAAWSSAVTNRVILYYRYHDGGKSRVKNRIYRYQGKEISAGDFCLGFAELASQMLPAKFNLAIAQRYLQLCDYYQVKTENLTESLAALGNQKDRRIRELEKVNADAQRQLQEVYGSRTWKVGKLGVAPVKVARRARSLFFKAGA